MEGPALIQVNVLNEVGGAHSGQPVCLSWPTLTQPADYLPYLDPAGMKSPWTNRGIIQYTMGGTTGFGIGADSYIKDPAAGGPYSVFVVSPSTYSDCVTGVGWLAGTNPRGPCRMTFQIVVDDPTLPEPEPEPGDGIDLETLVNAVDDLTAAVISLTETLREGWRLPGT